MEITPRPCVNEWNDFHVHVSDEIQKKETLEPKIVEHLFYSQKISYFCYKPTTWSGLRVLTYGDW